MRNYLTIDGVDSRDFNLYISGQGTFKAPARIYDVVSIPGRNGDLIISDNKYENIEVTYPAFIFSDFDNKIADLRSFLLSRNGYFRLEDTYHPGEYRQAYYQGPFEPDVESNNKVGSFDLVFNCKPQRWLLSGDTKLTANTGEMLPLVNPTRFPAWPTFYVYGAGTFSYYWLDSGGVFRGADFTIADSITGGLPTIIDTETMFIYGYNLLGKILNRSSAVTISGDVPSIPGSGSGKIDYVTATKVEVYPRWWTL